MKLDVPFLQLPILFDADRMAEEVRGLGEAAWRPHPSGLAGNDAITLITTGGDPESDALGGAMRPTPHLERSPYLQQVLFAIGATWGRTRLMRLSGHAEVNAHVDTNYYWAERMRVHVPVVTQPTVRFECGEDHVNMAAGECWVFDTWRRHRVINDQEAARIHLVADTVGGEGLWSLFQAARAPGETRPWQPRYVTPDPAFAGELAIESRNVPEVMSPWEVRQHLRFLMGEIQPAPQSRAVHAALMRFAFLWQALWARYGERPEGHADYGRLIQETLAELGQLGAQQLVLRNGVPFVRAAGHLVFAHAVRNPQARPDADDREESGLGAAAPPAAPALGATRDPVFERPVFIVCPPRSGSSLLFETLSQAPEVFTIGGESHGLIEGAGALGPAARSFASNRLTAADGTPDEIEAVRRRFWDQLRDRDGRRPAAGPVRLLEKTPKNALRVPFLAKAFPEARFVYLHRDPREVLASMIEAWSSGRFCTYPDLPGWPGPPWSLLLTPGWQALAGRPLSEIVAHQWATTVRTVLDDLEALDESRWLLADYGRLVQAPEREVRRLCGRVGFEWDRPLGPSLPSARHTLTDPVAGKWRARQAEIEAILPSVSAEIARLDALTPSALA